MDNKKSKYFGASEFTRCVPSCSIEDMEQHFLDWLDSLRERCGFPLVLSSAYRTREHDISKGRSGNSAHTQGLAVDIRCYNNATRMRIVKAALDLGCRRIGIANTFVHVDVSTTLPQSVMWIYK